MKSFQKRVALAALYCAFLGVSCTTQAPGPRDVQHATPDTQPAGVGRFPGTAKDDWKSYQAMHAYYVDRFVRSDGFGIGRMIYRPDQPRYWRLNVDGVHVNVRTMDLISLNGGKDPFAYVVDYDIPLKNRLAQLKRRPLKATESAALEELKAGEDVVLTTETNGSRAILGAVRATASCIKCHDVPQGTLLGAFSYPLQEPRLSAFVQISRPPS